MEGQIIGVGENTVAKGGAERTRINAQTVGHNNYKIRKSELRFKKNKWNIVYRSFHGIFLVRRTMSSKIFFNNYDYDMTNIAYVVLVKTPRWTEHLRRYFSRV